MISRPSSDDLKPLHIGNGHAEQIFMDFINEDPRIAARYWWRPRLRVGDQWQENGNHCDCNQVSSFGHSHRAPLRERIDQRMQRDNRPGFGSSCDEQGGITRSESRHMSSRWSMPHLHSGSTAIHGWMAPILRKLMNDVNGTPTASAALRWALLQTSAGMVNCPPLPEAWVCACSPALAPRSTPPMRTGVWCSGSSRRWPSSSASSSSSVPASSPIGCARWGWRCEARGPVSRLASSLNNVSPSQPM